jgi:hypothetical protein
MALHEVKCMLIYKATVNMGKPHCYTYYIGEIDRRNLFYIYSPSSLSKFPMMGFLLANSGSSP